MSTDPNATVVLTTVPLEAEAALLVAALADQGIEAMHVGELTTGFRAEAPGDVQILVRARDVDRAREILSDFEGQRGTEPSADEASES